MRTSEVVVVEPGSELMIAFLRIGVMTNVSPFPQGGLNEAFGFAVGAVSVRTGEAVLDAELEAGGAEVAGAIAGAVIGEQAANGDAVLGIEGDGGAQKGDGGCALLVGQDAGECEAGVIVDGDMQSLPAGELSAATPTASRTPLSFGEPLIRCSVLIVVSWLPTSAASAAFSAFPPPARALGPATRLIDIQLAAVELSTIQFGDRLVRVSRAGHLHEGRPTRLARITVGHDAYAIDRTISCEHLAQLVFANFVVKVPNEDVLYVDTLSFC